MKRLLFILLCSVAAWAQAPTGRQLGFGGAADLMSRTPEVLHGNPAILAAPDSQRMLIMLPAFTVGATNNAFSVKSWNDQIARDHYLTIEDKEYIMEQIPDDGLRVSGTASVPLFGGTFRKMAFGFSEEYALNVNADRELFELALYGNQLNRGYKLEDLGGEQYAILDAGVAVGYEFQQQWMKGLYGGLGFHFYYGQHYDRIVDAVGELEATDSLLTGYGAIQRVTASRGDGIGFDIGLLAELNQRWAFGLAMKQIGGNMTWVVDEARLDAFAVDSAGVIVDSLGDSSYVSRAFQSSSTVVAGGNIESKIPATLELSGRWKLSARALALATLRARFDKSAQGEPGADISLGGEYRVFGPLLLRAGCGSGGPLGTRYACGAGLHTRHYDLDLGASWHEGLFSSTQGLTFGIGHSLRW